MPERGVDRRRALAAAVLGRNPVTPGALGTDTAEAPGGGEPVQAVMGEVRDVSPHLIIIETATGAEERLVIAPWAKAWRGGDIPPGDLPAGAQVVLRAVHIGRVVERIWADITRITGVIVSVEAAGKDQVVDLHCGPHRSLRRIVIPYRASGRLRVRHPQLEPGYLFDAIGVREGGETYAVLPATSQPPYRAAAVPEPPSAYGGPQSRISGTVTWSDLFEEDERGAAYPMLERAETGCDDAEVSCVGLPYLALGSALEIGNECSGRTATVPIVACGCLAGRFCDRCVECGTSPRGRIAELSAASYVELGGDLSKGCFNARVGLG
jgi:hypothetical protein